MKKLTLLLAGAISAGCLTSCDDNDNGNSPDPQPNDSLELPSTYKWQDANYEKQTAVIELIVELSGEVGKANGGSVQKADLQKIFQNDGVVDADVSLAAQIPQQDQAFFNAYFDSLDTYSNDEKPGDSVIGDHYYLPSRVEPAQIIEKGLMGACLYYQATTNKLADLPSAKNENPKEGYTEREKQFDEAFGYFGAPTDLLNISSGERDEVAGEYKNSSWFWGHYVRTRNGELQNKEKLFNAFLKGRKAITEQRPEKREEAVNTIYKEWEKLVAANVAHYANGVIGADGNGDAKFHSWAEGKAFVMSLRYNPESTISDEQINTIDDLFGETPINVTQEDMEDVNQQLDNIYDFPTDISQF
jgi:hypothetical protein